MKQKIGNGPGVTVEKKSGIIIGTKHELIDLPGIYSLSPYTMEEKISQEFVLNEKIDLIINVVDSTNLERSLYLTTQLLELDCRVIVALNMVDILINVGIDIDDAKLEKQLGAETCRISAKNGIGIKNLINLIDYKTKKDSMKFFEPIIEERLIDIENLYLINTPNKRFISIRMLEGKVEVSSNRIYAMRDEIEGIYNLDISEIIAIQRYRFLDEVIKKCLRSKKIKKKKSTTDKIDGIFLNKFLAVPIFVFAMFLIYYLSVGVVGYYTSEVFAVKICEFKDVIENLLIGNNVSAWLISLVVDGLLDGIGAVLSFIPQLTMLFLCISIMESTGYMSRISLLIDKIFSKLGISGKSLISFIVGSGCSVPGIMSARIIEKEVMRNRTIILTPFIPCSAKLPIIALFSGYFFGEKSGLVSASFYFLSIIIIMISAYIFKKFSVEEEKSYYVSELPRYRLPSIKYIFNDVCDKVRSFLKRAGSTILICSIVVWFLLSFSTNFEYNVDIEESILATMGKRISWIFYPIIGENSWGATVSIIQGLVAKEQVVSSMSIISGLAENIEGSTELFKNNGIFSFFTPVSAYAFVAFNLFSVPCFGAIGAMKKELGSKKKLLLGMIFQTVTAYVIALVIFQVGSKLI